MKMGHRADDCVCVLEVLFDGHVKDRVFDKRAEVCVHAWEIR